MKGTTNAQRNAVVDSSYANNQLKLTYADGSVDTHTLASPIVIDDALSSTSTNPVQNKVVKGALDGKLGKTETAAKATADADGNTISTTYLKSATASSTYLKKSDAANTYATQDALASAIGSVYRYKNSVTNYSDLPSSGNIVGDVYNVVNAYGNVPAGTNWAWNGSAWDALAGTVDLSPYAKATDVANTYATQTALNNGLASKQNTLVVGTNLDSAPASGSTNPVTSGGVYSAINDVESRLTLAEEAISSLEDASIPLGMCNIGLTFAVASGENETATFNITGSATDSIQSDSNGYAAVELPAGTYTITPVADSENYSNLSSKTITTESRKAYNLTWYAAKPSTYSVTFTSPANLPDAVYSVKSGTSVMYSGTGWNDSMTFTLFPQEYSLEMVMYGHTLTIPFTAGSAGSTIDLTEHLSKLNFTFSSMIGGINATIDGVSVDIYSDLYVLKDGSTYSINIPAPTYKSGYPIVSFSAPSSFTADSTSIDIPISSVTGVLTLFTESGTVHLAKGKYRVVAVGGGGGGGHNNGGGGGGYITDSAISIDNSDVAVTIGAGGSANVSGGATSLGTLVAASGGSTAGTSSGDGGSGGSGGGGGIYDYSLNSRGYIKGGNGGRGYFGGGGGGGAQVAYSTNIGRGYGGSGGTKGGSGGTGGYYDQSSKTSVAASAGSAGQNAPSSDVFFYHSGGSAGGSVSGASNAPHTGGGGGGGYSARGGDGGKSMSTGSVYQIGGGGGGGGAMGGNGGAGKIASGAYANSGIGYGAGGGGITRHSSDYYGGGGGGGGYGTTPSSNTSGRGNSGCIRIQYVGAYE